MIDVRLIFWCIRKNVPQEVRERLRTRSLETEDFKYFGPNASLYSEVLSRMKYRNYFKDDINIFWFYYDNHIDINKLISSGQSVTSPIFDHESILFRNKVFDNIINEDVSIGDVSNYDDGNCDTLDRLAELFRTGGSDRQTRSLSMLKLSSRNALEILERSFAEEPIVLFENNGKYEVGDNGNHRFVILRTLYDSELVSGVSKEELDEKYKIKVRAWHTNHFRSYCNYLLKLFSGGSVRIFMSSENGNAILRYDDVDTEATDEEVLSLLKNEFDLEKEDDKRFKKLREDALSDGGLRGFLEMYFPEFDYGIDVSVKTK